MLFEELDTYISRCPVCGEELLCDFETSEISDSVEYVIYCQNCGLYREEGTSPRFNVNGHEHGF